MTASNGSLDARASAAAALLPACFHTSWRPGTEWQLPDAPGRHRTFLEEHRDLYDGVTSCASVALVLPWQWRPTWRDADRRQRILTDVLWSEGRLADCLVVSEITSWTLERYRLLVLVDLDRMADDDLKILRGYVMVGGSMIALGPTARFGADGKPRSEDETGDLLGPAHAGQNWDTVQTRLEKGRVTSFPTVTVDDLADDAHVRRELLREIDQMAGPRPLARDGPPGLRSNLVLQTNPPRVILHMVNTEPAPLDIVHVVVGGDAIDAGNTTILSPDPDDPALDGVTAVTGGVHFQVRHLDLYAAVLVPLET